jgi:glycosyltransferase involved in cell wall biosynthesis
LNLAAVGPLPPAPTGVADHTLVLLRHLRRHFQSIVAVVDQGAKPALGPGDVDEVFEYCDGDLRWWRAGHFLPLYQMGNHVRHHNYVYRLLTQLPGVTVLHDGNLLPFINAISMEQGRPDLFVRELSAVVRGGDGHQRAWNSIRKSEPLDADEFRLIDRVVCSSLGILVHNTFLRDHVLHVDPAASVGMVPLVNVESPDFAGMSRQTARHYLGLAEDDLLLGAIGFVAPSKRLDSVLRMLHQLSPSFPRLRLVCVGQVVPDYDLQAQIDKLGLGDRVALIGYVSPSQLELYVHAFDMGVNLRYPTWGEGSSALLRLMAAGKPTLVTDAGGFRDLPDDAVVKIPSGAAEVEVLTALVDSLLRDEDLRNRIGDVAQVYVRRNHDPEIVAAAYAQFIRTIVRGERWDACAEIGR